MSRDLVLGTAGHIDHGKSSLILALTGTDPDRLAEEKQRGITIELGFARLPLPDGTTLGVVDVPGHERFVRQMIAGSTGIDLALLCIAADDGIMPQTTEHLAVLELLGIPCCVVALTKTDLVDAEWVGFVKDEVHAALAGGPYADAEIVGVSSRTKEGLGELLAALERAAKATSRAKAGAAMRLPIDRVFTIKGAGTVITGTLWSGQVRPGDTVEVLPEDMRSRVRSVQIHGLAVDVAEAGHRVALNLSDLSTDDLRPGDFLAAPGLISPTDHFDVEFRYLGTPGSDKPFESGARVHVAHGTREVSGRVLLMGGAESLACGERAFAQVRTDEPLPVSYQDRFIVRSYSPVHVIGGGTVLRAHPKRSTAAQPEKMALLEALRAHDVPAAAEAAFSMASLPITAAELAASVGIETDEAHAQLEALVAARKAVRLAGGTGPSGGGGAGGRSGAGGSGGFFTTTRYLQRSRSAIEKALLAFHAENPAAPGIAKDDLHARALPKTGAACFDALLESAAQAGACIVAGGEVSHPQAGAAALAAEAQAADALAAALEAAGATPPIIDELFANCGVDQAVGKRALGALEKDGRARRVSKDLAFSAAALEQFEAAVRKRLDGGAQASATELKDAMGTSRKYAIPLLEHFDDAGITRRVGDARVLAR